MIFCKKNKLIVRGLECSDKHQIVKWLSDSKVLKYYEGRNNTFDEERVEENFYDYDVNKIRCIIEYDQKPIGYIQYYIVNEEELKEYGYSNFNGIIFGTDQFIGENEYLAHGIGTELMKLIINYLSTEKGAEKIVLDPQAWNERAIKCYEKSGFVKVNLLLKHELHEGELKDCWLMEYDARKIDR